MLPGQTFHNAYIVLDGLLQAATATGPVTIGPGDIFGAVPGLEDVAPPPDFVHAITQRGCCPSTKMLCASC